MKILYLSCHSILEYDEVKLLLEMGHDVFSHGAYMNPENQGDGLRPAIPNLNQDKKILEIALRTNKDHLTEEMVEPFDTVIVMSLPHWISNNWEVLKKKRVILRTIGQNSYVTEKAIAPFRKKGLQIIRYSAKEMTIPGYAGEDAIIRFYKEADVYGGWIGNIMRVINLTQSMKNRGRECNYAFYRRAMQNLPHTLFGPHNETIGEPWAKGALSFDQMLEAFRRHRAYFYLGTYPTSYTLNFIEAWMTGIPLVALGPERGNDPQLLGHALYEGPDLISHGKDGFYSDDPLELEQIFSDLLNDHDYAKAVSLEGRKKAIEIFGKEAVWSVWNNFLK